MRTARFALILLSLFAALIAQGQQCLPSDTPLQCWEKYVPALPASPDAAATETQMTAAEANTGITNLVSPSSTALKDFLSVLSASIESSSITDNGNTLTFDANLPSPLQNDAHGIKLQVVFTNPVLDPQIVTKLGTNAAGIAELNDQLTATDNLTASLSFNVATTSFGRSLSPHRDFFDALIDQVSLAELDASTTARLTALRGTPAITDPTVPFSTITDAVQQNAAITAFERSARATSDLLQGIEDVRAPFASLLSNQPQLYGSGLYQSRSDLVGPDEHSVKVTLEAASRNLRSFYKLYKTCTPGEFRNMKAVDRPAASADCLTKLKTYAAPLQNKDSSGRLSFSLDHRESGARSYTLPSNAGVVTNVKSTSLIATLVWGFAPMKTPSGTTGRLDFSATYENVSDDPLKDDRFVASATYTQKINDMLSIPISLIYANHSQYLSNVDEKLNAHFGVMYKLPTGSN